MSGRTASFAAIRAGEFPGLDDLAYFDVPSLGPLPERTVRAMAAFNERRRRVELVGPDDFLGPAARLRESAARLIGADPAEIALGGNTTFGITIATRLKVPHGSTVLISEREFPANVYPWMGARHLRLERLPTRPPGWPDEERLLDRLDSGDVSIVSISSVQFSNGYRIDLERLAEACRSRGIYLVVDAIQSLGQVPLGVDRIPIDILATGGHKWLCGPFGAGFAYVRRAILEEIDPGPVGWANMEASADICSLLDYRWSPVRMAQRFEGGTPPLQDYIGLSESIDLLLEVGVAAIQARIDALLEPLRHWLASAPGVELLSPLDPDHRSGIVSFRTPALEYTFERLSLAGIRCSLREGAIRIGAHLYNREVDVERTLEVLMALAGRQWR